MGLMDLQVVVLVLDQLHDVYGLCLAAQNSKESSQASVSIVMAVLEVYVHKMQFLISSLVQVDFKFGTSLIMILKPVRHQNLSCFH